MERKDNITRTTGDIYTDTLSIIKHGATPLGSRRCQLLTSWRGYNSVQSQSCFPSWWERTYIGVVGQTIFFASIEMSTRSVLLFHVRNTEYEINKRSKWRTRKNNHREKRAHLDPQTRRVSLLPLKRTRLQGPLNRQHAAARKSPSGLT